MALQADFVNLGTVPTNSTPWIMAHVRHNGPNSDIWGSVFKPSGGRLTLSEVPFFIRSVLKYSVFYRGLGIASTVSGGAPVDWRGALVVAEDRVTPDWAIRGALIYAHDNPAVGNQYCAGEVNSTGTGALILATGDTSITTVKELTTVNLPDNQFCYTITGTMPGFVAHPAGSDGNLCVGGALGRYNQAGEIGNSGSTGTFEFDIDPTQIRTNSGNALGMAGQTWHFQTWFRDSAAGAGHSNFSNGLALPLE